MRHNGRKQRIFRVNREELCIDIGKRDFRIIIDSGASNTEFQLNVYVCTISRAPLNRYCCPLHGVDRGIFLHGVPNVPIPYRHRNSHRLMYALVNRHNNRLSTSENRERN